MSNNKSFSNRRQKVTKPFSATNVDQGRNIQEEHGGVNEDSDNNVSESKNNTINSSKRGRVSSSTEGESKSTMASETNSPQHKKSKKIKSTVQTSPQRSILTSTPLVLEVNEVVCYQPVLLILKWSLRQSLVLVNQQLTLKKSHKINSPQINCP